MWLLHFSLCWILFLIPVDSSGPSNSTVSTLLPPNSSPHLNSALNLTSSSERTGSSLPPRPSNVTRVVVRRLGKRGDQLIRKESVRVESREYLETAASLRAEKESMEALQSMILGGKPGVDFPNYVRPPRTKFSCKKMDFGGMFADPETGCQAYHVCHNRRKDTFMCPTGTLFNQQIMACDFWYNVNCEAATQFYDMNVQLYHPYQSPRRTPVAQPTVSIPVQTTRRPSNPPPAPPQRPNVNRSDRPIIIPLNPIPSTTIRRPVYDGPPGPVPTTPIQSRPTPPPTSTTVKPSTTTTTTTTRSPLPISTSTTTETPRTRKATTPRTRVTTRRPTRPPPPGIEVDDRDWVFAWIKQGNGTRADKSLLREQENSLNSAVILAGNNNKMPLDHFPLFSLGSTTTDKRKTETAFSFHQDLTSSSGRSSSPSPVLRSNSPASSVSSAFNFRVIPSTGVSLRDSSRSLEDDRHLRPFILIKRKESELRGESSLHPNPWLFPLEHEPSQ